MSEQSDAPRDGETPNPTRDDAETTPRSDAPPAEAGRAAPEQVTSEPPASEQVPDSPALRVGWFLRATAVASGVAVVLAAFERGVEGYMAEGIVDSTIFLSAIFSYAMYGLLTVALFSGATEIWRVTALGSAQAARVGSGSRVLLIAGSGLVVALAAPAIQRPLHPISELLLAIAAAAMALTGAWHAIHAPHTRAAGAVLGLLAIAALLRLSAWELASTAGERASLGMFETSRFVASGAVFCEAMGQLVAATWIGTRTGIVGRIGSYAVVAFAFLVTWGAARGVSPVASVWQVVIHRSIELGQEAPPPVGLAALSVYLAPSAMGFALVASALPRQVSAIVAILALSLVARSSFDVPLCALAAAVAGQWLTLATRDDRVVWRAVGLSRAPGAW